MNITNVVIRTEKSGVQPAYILSDTNRQQVQDILKVCRQQKQTVTELTVQNKGVKDES